jgi:hypothetical protein
MSIRHIVALSAALLLTPSLMASEVTLGPEVPLAEISSKPTPVTLPLSAASNGNDFLVAWVTSGRVQVRRIGRDGIAVEQRPRTLDGDYTYWAKLVRCGNGYLLATGNDKWQLQRLDENGTPLSEPRRVPSIVSLTTNGSSYLLVYAEFVDAKWRRRGMILDAQGAPLRQLDFDFRDVTAVGVHDGHYVLVVLSKEEMSLRAIADDGTISATTDLTTAPLPEGAGVLFGQDQILFFWLGINIRPKYAILAYDGSVIQGPSELPAFGSLRGAAWDGHQFLLVTEDGKGFRLAPDGTLLDPSGFTFYDQKVSDIAFAFSDAEVMVISAVKTGAVTRVARDFDALATDNDPGTILTSPAEQLYAQMARGPRGLVTAWMDSSGYEVRGMINGKLIVVDRADGKGTVGWPAVSAGANVSLVAWWYVSYNTQQSGSAELRCQRYDSEGLPLDPKPIVIDKGFSTGPLAVAFDGSFFRMVWKHNSFAIGSLMSARIGETGEPFSVEPILDLPRTPWGNKPFVEFVRALGHGGDSLIIYRSEDYSTPDFIGVARPTDALGASPRALFSEAGIRSFRIGATIANGRVTYAWVAAKGSITISVGQTSLDGSILVSHQFPLQTRESDRQHHPPRYYYYADPEIAWNGSEYVLTWIDYGPLMPGGWDSKVMAVRLDAQLKQIDPQPFQVAALPAAAESLLLFHRGAITSLLVPTPRGAIIAYTRFDDGTPRIVTRTLEGPGSAPRRRAIGH